MGAGARIALASLPDYGSMLLLHHPAMRAAKAALLLSEEEQNTTKKKSGSTGNPNTKESLIKQFHAFITLSGSHIRSLPAPS
jgi:hypothetical protein